MLGAMRRSTKALKIVLWFVIFAFLATIVVVWGMGQKQTVMGYAAKVGDEVISIESFQNYYQNALEQARQLGEPVTSNNEMTAIVIQDMVEQYLLLMEANRLKIPVSDAEVVKNIMDEPAFRDESGEFSTDRYQEIVGIPSRYEESVRDTLRVSKLLGLVYGTVAVNPEEVAKEYNYLNTKLSVSYFAVSPFDYITQDTPADEELSAFYENNKERYRVPAGIKLKYIVFDKAEWQKKTNFTPEISEEDAQMRYTADIALYSQPQQADISQISFLFPNQATEADIQAAKEKAEAAMAAIEEGLSFEEVVKRYSPDHGGPLGRIMRSNNESELENEVFSLKNGEYTQIHTSAYGFAIYKMDNMIQASVTPFSQVKDEILRQMTQDALDSAYRNVLNTQYMAIVKAGNISAYASTAENVFEVHESDFIYENEESPLFGSDPSVKEMLFRMGRTELSNLADIDNKTYLFEITERENSYIPGLDAVKEQVLTDYKTNEAFQAAIEDVYAKIGDDDMHVEGFAAASAELGRPISVLPSFTRFESPAGIPRDAALTNELFFSYEGKVVKYIDQPNKQIYIFRVAGLTQPNTAIPEEEKQALESYLLSTKQADAKKWLVSDLKKRYKVEINPQFTVQ